MEWSRWFPAFVIMDRHSYVPSRFLPQSKQANGFRSSAHLGGGAMGGNIQYRNRGNPMRMMLPPPKRLPPSGPQGHARRAESLWPWGIPYRQAPNKRHRLSLQKNQRNEEQRQPGTMRSRLPRTACLLRIIALCILLSHTAAYFGSDYYFFLSLFFSLSRPVVFVDRLLCPRNQNLHKPNYARVIVEKPSTFVITLRRLEKLEFVNICDNKTFVVLDFKQLYINCGTFMTQFRGLVDAFLAPVIDIYQGK